MQLTLAVLDIRFPRLPITDTALPVIYKSGCEDSKYPTQRYPVANYSSAVS